MSDEGQPRDSLPGDQHIVGADRRNARVTWEVEGEKKVRSEDVNSLNQAGWDRRVEEQDIWTQPVGPEATRRARGGKWSVVLTPKRPVPRNWFGEVAGKDILCLASGGGQQCPILAAAGARVVVFDASANQLAQDAAVARRDNLPLLAQQGFMHDLSVFADDRFDLVFHPVSNAFAPEIEPVWRECFRVLRPGGVLLAGFMNPMVYVFDPAAEERGELVVKYALPYAEVHDLTRDELLLGIERDHTIEFSHSLEAQIGGQIGAIGESLQKRTLSVGPRTAGPIAGIPDGESGVECGLCRT